ncbi:MAG TPA: PilZ domain-containing protein [Verrucomicrobiae bacterium]|nr:PilZ domain-containing protein [Verrucomicrobiae bacterium]
MSRIWDALKLAQKHRVPRPSPEDFDPLASPSSSVAAASESDRRKSDRTPCSFLILVYGSDSDHQPFHEEVETLDFTDAGCSLNLETLVEQGQRLFLTNMDNNLEAEARVVNIGRRFGGHSRVGLEFSRPSSSFWSRP